MKLNEMQNKTTAIKQIKNFIAQSKKLLILAIGSELRLDDAVGMYIADELIKENFDKEKILIIKGSTAPENFTGEIKKYRPTDMLIIDAADTNKQVGDIDIIDVSSVTGASFSTHMMPINVFIDYLLQDFDCKILIVGIQPKTLEFGTGISDVVRKSADEIVVLVKELIKK